jgi:predicted ribosome quality control (RQC) complex YloA/Tae2 family protein
MLELTNLSLAYLLLELQPVIENSIVRSVQELSKNTIRLRLHTKQGSKNLIVMPNAIYFSDYKMTAMQNMHGFAAFLKKHLAGKKIEKIEQKEFERILLLSFTDYYLVFELFSDGNILLLDKEKKILGNLHRQEWKDRSIKKGATYKFPASRGLNPAKLSFEEFSEKIKESNSEIVRGIIKLLNVAPVFAEEACLKTGIDKKTKANLLEKKELEKLFGEIKKIYSVSEKELQPVKAKNLLLPFSVSSMKEKQEKIASINSALDEHYSVEFLTKETSKATEKKQKEISRIEHSLKSILETKEKFLAAEKENKKKGELIYSNYGLLKELFDAVQSGMEKKITKEEIMYKMGSAAEKGSKAAKALVDIDLKKKEIVVDLE